MARLRAPRRPYSRAHLLVSTSIMSRTRSSSVSPGSATTIRTSAGELGDPPSAAQSADAISAIHFAQQVSSAYSVAVWVYIAAFVVWFMVVGRIVKGLGAPRQVLQHWTVAAWRIGLVISVGVVVFLSTPPSNADDLASARAALLDFDGRQMIYTGLRIVIAGLLVAAIWILNGRVSKLISARQSVSA